MGCNMTAAQTSFHSANGSDTIEPAAAATTRMWPMHMVGQQGKPVRVFLADDDCHIRRVIAQDLMSDIRTLLVGQAGSLREARKNICLQEFDVLMVDLNLGDGEGMELLDLVRETLPQVLSIVVSVTERDDKVFQAFDKGAVGYLLKNSWFGDYSQAVLQVANGGASITPSLAKKMLSRLDKTYTTYEKSAPCQQDEKLSEREIEILKLIACGYNSPEIASYLKISTLTVATHVKNIYRKLQAHTRAHAVRAATLRGIL